MFRSDAYRLHSRYIQLPSLHCCQLFLVLRLFFIHICTWRYFAKDIIIFIIAKDLREEAIFFSAYIYTAYVKSRRFSGVRLDFSCGMPGDMVGSTAKIKLSYTLFPFKKSAILGSVCKLLKLTRNLITLIAMKIKLQESTYYQ